MQRRPSARRPPGGGWPERGCGLELSGHGCPDGSTAIQLLEDVRTIFQNHGAERLSSERLVQELAQMEDRPWPEWRAGQPITKVQFARVLAPFGVQPKVLRLAEAEISRGYRHADLKDAFARYLR